ncbi:YchJ family protein [Sinomonas sp. ASV486]|uniref:YchJ family protein n=1 Tax=Sinomonas sp. ASV486 TaxID=3051170 RepID=UPI0027DC46BA|nr:YchJ family protein [Sinomonas sp. ASV486]MDQ4490010.1 YchJ family protein [Sinomonas sp. ASV486]
MTLDPDSRCPCCSGDTYGACCGRFHSGLSAGALPPTAEALMRSRYSAFVGLDAAYLLATWHPSTRPATLELDETTQWRRLDVVRTTAGGPFDTQGTVDFAAHWREGGDVSARRGVMREHSRFVREGGRWFYLDGDAS